MLFDIYNVVLYLMLLKFEVTRWFPALSNKRQQYCPAIETLMLFELVETVQSGRMTAGVEVWRRPCSCESNMLQNEGRGLALTIDKSLSIQMNPPQMALYQPLMFINPTRSYLVQSALQLSDLQTIAFSFVNDLRVLFVPSQLLAHLSVLSSL